jgi:hypothetical protein
VLALSIARLIIPIADGVIIERVIFMVRPLVFFRSQASCLTLPETVHGSFAGCRAAGPGSDQSWSTRLSLTGAPRR